MLIDVESFSMEAISCGVSKNMISIDWLEWTGSKGSKRNNLMLTGEARHCRCWNWEQETNCCRSSAGWAASAGGKALSVSLHRCCLTHSTFPAVCFLNFLKFSQRISKRCREIDYEEHWKIQHRNNPMAHNVCWQWCQSKLTPSAYTWSCAMPVHLSV